MLSAPLVAILAYGYLKAGLAVLLLALVPILAASACWALPREDLLARRLSEGNIAFALALVARSTPATLTPPAIGRRPRLRPRPGPAAGYRPTRWR